MAECLVCGEAARSKEHVIPQWLSRHVGERDTLTEITETLAEDGSTTGVRQRDTTSAARKSVKVCATCNNGWMAALEDWSKPYLKRLAEGEPGVITGSVATVLLAWSMKTTVVGLAASGFPLDAAIARPMMQGLRDREVAGSAFLRVGMSPFDEQIAQPASLLPVCTDGKRDVGLQGLILVGSAILRVGWIAPGVRAAAAEMLEGSDGLVLVYPQPAPQVPWTAGRWLLGEPDLPNVMVR